MRPRHAIASIPPRISVAEVEEGSKLAPKIDNNGLMPCITTNADSGEVLMLGWMNDTALRLTLQTGEAYYFNRARQSVWHKGATSGLVQRVVEARIDDGQDAIWLRVAVAGTGASCHVGYRSCFYRAIPAGSAAGAALRFIESTKIFDPVQTYGDAPNPTKL